MAGLCREKVLTVGYRTVRDSGNIPAPFLKDPLTEPDPNHGKAKIRTSESLKEAYMMGHTCSSLTLVQPVRNAVVDGSGLAGLREAEVLSSVGRHAQVDVVVGHQHERRGVAQPADVLEAGLLNLRRVIESYGDVVAATEGT
ncbi:hypothetical protein ANN_12064 [Periplaneta americana]|uniref:Uncharacterized protein n=1 Tax=Periplaneta americana TaxID=6978 RepID=A0ABQ8T6S5_PERAM|nr:hypothetical protein ANN_12064 [Periplaneta americana]